MSDVHVRISSFTSFVAFRDFTDQRSSLFGSFIRMVSTHILNRNIRCYLSGIALIALGSISVSSGVSEAQTLPQNSVSNHDSTDKVAAGRQPAKVAILLTPTGPDTARVVLSYGTRISHEKVREDIQRVSHFTQGKVGSGVQIEDASLDTNNLKRFPIMTAAQFELSQAPQFQDDAPRVLPYIQAFQDRGSIDILVHLAGVVAAEQPQRYENNGVSIWLNRDQGMMRYHAEVGAKNGIEALQALQFPSPSVAVPLHPTERATEKASVSYLVPILLIGLGGSLAGGACIYLFVLKRSSRNSSARSYLS